MVAPKTDGAKYDQLNVKDEIAREEELIAAQVAAEDEETPLDFKEFQRRFQNKQTMANANAMSPSNANYKA